MDRKRLPAATLPYLIVLTAVAAALLILVSGFNILVDPFAMYRAMEIPGFNISKPSIYRRMRLYKAFEIKRVKPQTVIVGSSRTHVGLRCSHQALSRLAGPCYNLAFDGATTKEIYFYLRHAHAIRPLQHVILGLDRYHATSAPAFTRSDYDPLLLYSPEMPRWLNVMTADVRLLTHFDTLRASIHTLRSQDDPAPHWFASDGQRLGDIFFRQVEPTFIQDGPRAYFDAIDRQEVQDQFGPIPTKQQPKSPVDLEESALAYIRRIVEFCRSQQIDLRIFITPTHVHQSEISVALWGEPSLESGKRALVQLLTEDAARFPDRPLISLMDFNGYSPITTEPLPPIGSRKEMRFYWDSSHFKEIVGDYILDRLFAVRTAGRPVPPDFGILLNAKTLDTALAREREARMEYLRKFPKDVAALQALIPGLPILVYHQILRPNTPEPIDDSTAISLEQFESQMRYLHEQGYRTLNMDEVVDYLKHATYPQKVVAIHFDDGWKSGQNALPILKDYGFKATFWIIAGAGHDIGSPHMGWDEILTLAQNTHIDIHSHTMTHPWKKGETLIDWVEGPVPGKGIKHATWELTESRKRLEEKLGRPVRYLAWPSGLYNDVLIHLAEQAGYQALLTIDEGINRPGNDLMRIHRTMINGTCDIEAFKQSLVDGSYNCSP